MVQIDKTIAAKLQKVVKQFAGKEIKFQNVGEMVIDSNKVNAKVESVDGKYEIEYSTKTGEVWSVCGSISIDKISKKDQDKALQELKRIYPNKTYVFEKEVKAVREYDNKKAKFKEETWYTFRGENFDISLIKNSLTTRSFGAMIKFDAKELEPKLLKTASEAVKMVLDQDFNLTTEAKLIPGEFDYKNNLSLYKWALEGNDVLVEIEAKSDKVLNVIHETRHKQKVTTNKEITEKDAKEVIAPMAKKLFNIDITGYEVKWDNLFKDYRFVKGEETMVRAALDADKNVVYIKSGSRAAAGN
ncbi:hypothetical protein SAMN05661091_1825 [Paenibacillus uliginis N3/975]|uniref:Uncharacterized protein n=1 Tax=Paenibacillus uliginis N3/975 TaxID=1313296 RepID=A0A1X7H664_9BACL|nr:hypothetical protein [Paenibacillus uliginis]SMF80301.1 hypothetical protein SAMN05661091_1825 [Paenibacillus uliginis N3/975]